MSNLCRILGASAVALAVTTGSTMPADAQQSVGRAGIPTRVLNLASAVTADSLGTFIVVRALSTGAILVNDVQRYRVLHFDASLKISRVVMDSAVTAPTVGRIPVTITSQQLIPYPGDSSLFVDLSTQSLLVLNPDGRVARVMALPHPQDASVLAQGRAFGPATIDGEGRLVYRTTAVSAPKSNATAPDASWISLPEQPDSASIVRADFDTRKIDTLITLKAFKPGKRSVAPDKQGNMVISVEVNPLDAADEWTMLTDGTIAIVRAHDYHIDWLDGDGTRRSTPKMPLDWKRLTDEQKQFKVDSIRPQLEKQSQATSLTIPTTEGPRRLIMNLQVVPANKLADYEPPLFPGAVRADLDNNLWILPRTAVPDSDGGLRYDVVNRKGEIFQRVRLPKGRVLAGFGPNGAIYVLSIDGKRSVLERTTLK